jgi:undecaprenyl-diphosphatase
MIIFFWRDWVRIIVAFFASVRHVAAPEPGTRRWEPQNTDQKLAWLLILGTIPVGVAGVALQHVFTDVFSKPKLVAIFLFVNGLILLGGERMPRWPRTRWPPSGSGPPSAPGGPGGPRPAARLAAAGTARGSGR